ncbi:META domain-containing protein [Dongshaea marina]|uniref:META domain-containing protein n=1 Tax=Dongshaea marina TaxID=2047966 RepID=UPI00131EFFC3|nr:META domain-containing protein [Dongshaea marina]
MKKLFVLATAVGAIGLAGCQSSPASMSQPLEGHRFILQKVDGVPFSQTGKKTPFIEFSKDGRVIGSMCNHFFGKSQWNESHLQASELVTTRMICASTALNSAEGVLTQALAKGVDTSFENGVLTLKNADHTLVYKLDSASASK